MTDHSERFRAYIAAYAERDIARVTAMFADDVHLRDWNLSVRGRARAVAETAANFASAASIAIEILNLTVGPDSAAGELRIVVDGAVELFVVDVVEFAPDGRIRAIRAYKGRGDAQ